MRGPWIFSISFNEAFRHELFAVDRGKISFTIQYRGPIDKLRG